MSSRKYSAAILGATGLVGSTLLAQLLLDDNYQNITIIVRRNYAFPACDKLRVVVTDFSTQAWHEALHVDHVFCCLGTTIKVAGSDAAFYAIDYQLVVDAATAAAKHGAHFLVISALGADPNSSVFYNRVKGEMEDSVRALALKKLSIFQPSLLTGPRAEFRLGERFAQLFMWILPKQWRSIAASTVANSMRYAAQQQMLAIEVFTSKQMLNFRHADLKNNT